MSVRPVSSPVASASAGLWPVRLPRPLLFGLALLGVCLWSYAPVLRSLWRDWQGDDNYSVCQLVPLAAAYLLWRRRKSLARVELRPCWWGVGVVLLAQAALGFGLVFMFESAERYAVVLSVVGLVLLVGGVKLFRSVWWALLFLFLMVPLPGRVHNLVSSPLQAWSTQGAMVALELMGISTLREGHVLVLNGHTHVAVAEACSGLRMLTSFVVVAYAFACLVNRPAWQKVTLALSSVPVAIICNLVRLVVTSLLFLAVNSRVAESFFHDFAGITMMPLAFALLVGELWVMARLVETPSASLPPARGGSAPA